MQEHARNIRNRNGARPSAARPPIDPDKNYATMRVFYATDRAAAKDFAHTPVADRYLGGRGRMAYGEASVSIPRKHVAGELEAPSIWRLEFRDDPARHVVLLSATPQPRQQFLQALKARVAGSQGRNAFVFVHGYNVSFADAARRTAQLSYDLSFDGAPIFFSWPSQASLSGYTVDESNIEWSTSHIKRFLIDVAEHSGADNLYLVGHSMGNRGLTRALAALVQERPDLRGRFREIILAAPDIDADVFREQIVPILGKSARHSTLYVSKEDEALGLSSWLHEQLRAGAGGVQMFGLTELDVVDASNVPAEGLAHSYYAENKEVIDDIFMVVRRGLPPEQRNLKRYPQYTHAWRLP